MMVCPSSWPRCRADEIKTTALFTHSLAMFWSTYLLKLWGPARVVNSQGSSQLARETPQFSSLKPCDQMDEKLCTQQRTLCLLRIHFRVSKFHNGLSIKLTPLRGGWNKKPLALTATCATSNVSKIHNGLSVKLASLLGSRNAGSPYVLMTLRWDEI